MDKEEKQNNLIHKIHDLIVNEGYEVGNSEELYPDEIIVYDNGEKLLGIEFY